MRFITRVALVVLLISSASISAFANSVTYLVSLNSAPLVGNAAGPFSLNFQLSDGSGTGNGNNTAKLSGFNFGTGGAAVGSPFLMGGASGDIASGVVLTDTSFLNGFTQQFVPGSSLRFLLSLTNAVEPGGTPDEFSFAILDSSGFELPYDSPFSAALVADITDPLTFQTFATNGFLPPAGGGLPIAMARPDVVATPELSSLPLLCIGALLVGGVHLQRRRFDSRISRAS